MRNRLLLALVVLASSLGFIPAESLAATCTSVTDQLTANSASVVVTCLPSGATSISAAESTAGTGGTTKYGKTIAAAAGTTFTPSTPGYPWAGMIAKNSSGGQVGSWAPRLQTVPGGSNAELEEAERQLTAAVAKLKQLESEVISQRGVVSQDEAKVAKLKEKPAEEPPKEEEPKLEEPPHEEIPGGKVFYKGVNGGKWGPVSNEISDYKKLGPNPSVRLENPGNTSSYTQAGIRVIYLLNHYNTGGIKSVNVANYVSEAKAVHAQNPEDVIEVENEPGGNWFWGNGAESQENATAYDHLLKEVHLAIPGAKLEASFDGGHAGDDSWGERMLKGDSHVAEYVSAFTSHPYDGSGVSPSSTLVRWSSVQKTHELTGRPVDISEYGRPLVESTGDSPKSTEAQQATADGAMVKKARESGFVEGVEIYGYRGNSKPCYAIFKENDEPRPAVAAVAAN